MAAIGKAPARLRQIARDRLAATYAVLGLYERALEIDSGGLEGVGRHKGRERRRLYSLIQLDDATNALGLADALGKPVFLFKQEGVDLPADFSGIHYYTYKLNELEAGRRRVTDELKKWAEHEDHQPFGVKDLVDG